MSAIIQGLGTTFQRQTDSPIDSYYVVSSKTILDRFAHGGMFVSLTYEGQLAFCKEDDTLYIFRKDGEDHFYYEPAQISLGFEEVDLQLDGEVYSPDLGEDDPVAGTIYKATGTFETAEVTKYYHWKSEWIEIADGFFGSGGGGVTDLGTYATEALFFAGLFDSDVADGIYTAIITNNEYVANAKTRVLAVLQTDAAESYRSSHVTYTGNIGAFTKNVLYNISTSTTTRDLPITYNLLNANYSEEDVLDYISTISLQNLTDPPVITTNIYHEACQVVYKKSGTTLYAMFYFADRIKKVEYNLSTSTITTSVNIAYEDAYDLAYNATTVGDALDDIEDALDILLGEV